MIAKATSSSSGTFACAPKRPGRVLVIDDERAMGSATRRILSDICDVVALDDPYTALAALEAGEVFDLILCDLMMPGLDGIELHRRLSASNPHEADRIVFITGEAHTARVEAFTRRVSNLVLEKPLDIDGLRALVARRVGAMGASRSVA